MSNYIFLAGLDGTTIVRSALTSLDASWVPEDEGVPKDFILDAREYDTVRITPVFLDGGGLVVDGTSVAVEPLIAIRSPDGTRLWRALAVTGATTDDAFAEVSVQSSFCAFRLTGLTLGGATSVNLTITGGSYRQPVA